MIAFGQVEEATPFPFDLDEETVIPMMVDGPQTYEEPSLALVIEEVLGDLEREVAMPTGEGQEAIEEVPESFSEEIPGDRDYMEGVYVEAEHEENVPEVFSQAEESDEVQLEVEDVGRSIPPLQRW